MRPEDLLPILAPMQPWLPYATAGIALLAVLFALLAWRGSRTAGALADGRLERIADAIDGLRRDQSERMQDVRAEAARDARSLREEVTGQIAILTQSANAQQKEQLSTFAEHLRLAAENAANQSRLDHEALVATVKALRDATGESLKGFAEAARSQSAQMLDIQRAQHAGFELKLAGLTEAHAKSAEALRQALDVQLATLRKENSEKLEVMRATVDEKLQGSLERRLGESFKVVSERLEAVHKGLGEMQTLANGVGDLKRLMSNVKARGTWGEVQLGALLEQILTPSQYATNVVVTPGSAERVEFAIRLPGNGRNEEVLLPVDAKFPVEDYDRLHQASEAGDVAQVELASRALDARLRASARDISDKYVAPPHTTDFAIMFLPTEGLYAEAIRRPGLADDLQRNYRVIVAGPTTLTAILNSLQMGFRTLAIQERSSEVWRLLGAVKTEFGNFGPILSKVKKKLQEASNHIEGAETRTRVIARKLRDVESLPLTDTAELLGTPDMFVAAEADEEEGRLIASTFFGDDDEEPARRPAGRHG